MIAIDTNLLIYAHRSGYPQHEPAIRALENAFARTLGWGIPLPCILEFWSIVTHPQMGRPSSFDEAHSFLANILEDAQGFVFSPLADTGARLMQLASEFQIAGARIFDLQIALIALDNGVSELWSHDRSFCSLPGLKVVDPIE